MEISLTLFNSIFDNKTQQKLTFENFDSFEKALYGLAQRKIKSKKDAPLMSPAQYKPDTTRKNDNVTMWSAWCAVDVDDFKFDGDLNDAINSKFNGTRFICYSTASSTQSVPKFRLVFPLTKNVPAEKIRHFWYALQTELGDMGDKQTKDLSRMYYIPAKYDNAYNFIFSGAGDTINPDSLMNKYPYKEKSSGSFFDRLPEDMKKEIIEHRKSKLDNTNINWSSYKNCPFFPRQLEKEYRMITNTGWYHKMYQIMVAIAGNAVKNKYPITAQEITNLCRELDVETGNWYKSRPLEKEADRALEYVYKNI
tara:strand:- start:1047 stop:1973 length:927 start_codon:yes stop_codon:yes gene_type:complete